MQGRSARPSLTHARARSRRRTGLWIAAAAGRGHRDHRGMITSASPARPCAVPELAPTAPVIPRSGDRVPGRAGSAHRPGVRRRRVRRSARLPRRPATPVDDLRGGRLGCGSVHRPRCPWPLHRLHDGRTAASGPDPGRNAGTDRIRLIGAGPVGLAVARQLIDRGIAALYVFDAGPPDPSSTPPPGLLPDRADSAVLGRRRPRHGDRAAHPLVQARDGSGSTSPWWSPTDRRSTG